MRERLSPAFRTRRHYREEKTISMTFSERLHNETMRKQLRYVFENGRGYYIENGQPYTEEEIHKKYPVAIKAHDGKTKENVDGTKKWLY